MKECINFEPECVIAGENFMHDVEVSSRVHKD